MNAIDMLKEDHRHIKQLIKQLCQTPSTNPQARRGLVERLEDSLFMHMRMEEDVFFPALHKTRAGHEDTLASEALEEHRVIEQKALPDLKEVALAGDAFEGRAQVLKELVERNIQREEKDIFPIAQNAMSAAQLNEVGHLLAVRRNELFSEKMAPENPGHTPQEVHAMRAAADKARLAVESISRDPAKALGRGVEELVRVGTRLASEITEGARRGMREARHDDTER